MKGRVKRILETLLRIAVFALMLLFWSWLMGLPFAAALDLGIIAGFVLLIFPLLWLGRKILDRRPTLDHTVRVTTVVHYAVVFLLGASAFRAVATYPQWPDWTLPIPSGTGLALVILTGAWLAFTVANLALKGLGAPFAISLSRKTCRGLDVRLDAQSDGAGHIAVFLFDRNLDPIRPV
jgi:hypothetical protein